MAVPFYDNRDVDGRSGTIDVERIYCFDFGRFTDAEWAELDRVYRNLPGFVGYDPVPWWFGNTEQAAPHLWASAEPSGLQVAGVLPLADWLDWDQRFRVGTAGLPSYEFQ